MERRIPSIEESKLKPRDIITDELVGRIRKIAGNLDDTLELADLRPLPKSKKDLFRKYPEESEKYSKRYLGFMGFKEDRNSPKGWDEFWASLSIPERSYLSRTLHHAIKTGLFTVGDVRDARYEGLIVQGDRPKPMGPVRAAFLKGIFEPQ